MDESKVNLLVEAYKAACTMLDLGEEYTESVSESYSPAIKRAQDRAITRFKDLRKEIGTL